MKTTTIFVYFLVCYRLSNDDVEGARGTVFQAMRPGAGFETADFVKELLGGATVERLAPDIYRTVRRLVPIKTVNEPRYDRSL